MVMKIAVFHELHKGGAMRVVNEFSKRLNKGNLVDLYVVDYMVNKDKENFFTKIFYYKFVPKKWNGGNWKVKFYKDTIELFDLYRLHKKIAKEIDDREYELVFVHPSKITQAPFLLRFLKTKKIYYCQETLRKAHDPIFKISKNLSMSRKIYEKISLYITKQIDTKNILKADIVLANSKNTKINIKRAYGIQSEVLYLGVDENFFKPGSVKKNIDILYIGAKDEVDGYQLLKSAVKLLSPKPIVKYHITYHNWIDDTKLRELYRRSKVVVCLAKNEPFGLTPLEAGACGVPVIALNGGGYRETVISEKTGLFTTGNAKDLAEKITFLLKNKKKREKIGEAARSYIKNNWTWDSSISRLEQIFSTKKFLKTKASTHLTIKSNETLIKILALSLIFIFCMSLRFLTLNQIGRTWDEAEYVEPGYRLIELIKKMDLGNSFFYTSYNHPPLVKYLYGITAYFDLEKISNDQPVFHYDLTYSRSLSAVMFSLGVVIVVLIGWKIFSPWIGIFSGIILSMLPFSLGLSQLVTAESLKILTYPLAILSYISLIHRFSIKKIIVAGILTGIALQAKQSDALLLLILAIMFFLQYNDIKVKQKIGYAITRALALVAVLAIAILVFVLLWPQVIFYYNEINAINQQLWNVQFSTKPWQITLAPPEIFFGRLILVPIFYYPVYFLITIPLFILALFFVGVLHILKNRIIGQYVILVWFLVPLIVMSFYSWRQHGLRYVIEIYPAIAIVSAVGFDAVANKIGANSFRKLLLFIPVVIYLFISIWQIRPYYLDYFNELVGGTGTVYKYNLFQTGWWGQGEREAGLYLKKNARYGSKIGLALSPEHTFPTFDSLNYFKWLDSEKYDFVVVNHYHIIRDGFDDSGIRKNYNLVYQAKADGATLVYIYEKK